MITRALTGRVIRPDGVGITTGSVRVTPVLPVPANGISGVLAPTAQSYPIVAGEITGSIVAPCSYIFEVFDGQELVWRFRRTVAEVPTATTLQAIYIEGATLPSYDPDALFEGDDLVLLGSAGALAGQVPTADGAGGITWSSAGAGDMAKATYDTDDDGIVDAAASVPWTGVTGAPTAYPPAAHAATHATGGGDTITPAAIGAAAAVHASAHATGGGDAIAPADIGAAAAAHGHAAGDITSGQLATARGGTGQDSSAWTGVPLVTAGVWASGAAAADVSAIPREAGIVAVSSGRDLAASDAGKILECDGTVTLTAPNGLPTGFQVVMVNVGSGAITLAAAGTLQSKGAKTRITSQYAAATLYHRGANVWLAVGDLST